MENSLTASVCPGVHGQHWVRYGIAADQKYLLGEFLPTYDQLVVNGNMLAHMKSALSQFITQQVAKPFIIDPQTHAFAHDLEYLLSTSKGSAGKIKRSWAKLIEAYGPLVEQTITKENRPLDPSDLEEASVRSDFVERVLLFQRDSIVKELEEGADREYLQFLKEETGVDPFLQPPSVLIAPYFFIDGPLADKWAELSIQLIEDARAWTGAQNHEQPPVAAQLVISKEILFDSEEQSEIIRRYAAAKPDLILLWIDQFSEHNATARELNHYLDLLGAFQIAGIPVVNLFGGFFSVALMRFSEELRGALAAVCHGLEYGETRPVIPLGGGTPVARFYSRTLHHRLPPRVALREIDALGGFASLDAFQELICDCPNCKAVITGQPRDDLNEHYFESKESTFWANGRLVSRDFPTARASDNCTRHYMWSKHWEYRQLSESMDVLKKRLHAADEPLRKILGAEHAGHPKVWAQTLR